MKENENRDGVHRELPPEGRYNGKIIKAELYTTKKGAEMIRITYSIMEVGIQRPSLHEAREVCEYFDIAHAQYGPWNRKRLTRLAEILDEYVDPDDEETFQALVGCKVSLTVVHKEGNGTVYANVKEVTAVCKD